MKTNFLYGAIGGDIIGSKYERKHIKRKDFQLFHGKSSHITDDTVFTCATAEAILTTKDIEARLPEDVKDICDRFAERFS